MNQAIAWAASGLSAIVCVGQSAAQAAPHAARSVQIEAYAPPMCVTIAAPQPAIVCNFAAAIFIAPDESAVSLAAATPQLASKPMRLAAAGPALRDPWRSEGRITYAIGVI